MKSLELLTMVRNVLNTAKNDCVVQQFKPEVIHRDLIGRLGNISTLVNDKTRNKKNILKQRKMLVEVINALPHNTKSHYDTLAKAIDNAINTLPSAMDFID